jgi:hypothetical protein
VLSRIWDDREFIALDPDQQRMYLFLLSQSDLSHAGLIPLRLKRWASKAAALSPDGVLLTLKSLEVARFVLVDEETEEVLIRTLVRNDNVYRQPKVMIRMAGDARQIASPRLRAAFVAEMLMLPLHELEKETQRQAARDVVAALVAEFGSPKPYREGYREGYSDDDAPLTMPLPRPDQPDSGYVQVDTPTEGYPEGYPEGYREGFQEGYGIPPARAGAPSPFPLPPTPTPPKSSPSPAETLPFAGDVVTPDGVTERQKPQTLDEAFAEFWDAYPRKVGKQDARKVWDQQRRKTDPAVILAGVIRYRDDPNRTAKFTAHPATWLRRGGWDDEPLPTEDHTAGPVSASEAERARRHAKWDENVSRFPSGGDPWNTRPLPPADRKEITAWTSLRPPGSVD